MKRIKTLILSLLNLRTFLKMEFNRKQAPKVGHKVNYLKSGFLSISSVFYDFSNNDIQDYLNLYSFISNPPRDKHLKVEKFMNLEFGCRILHRYRG